MAKFQIQRTSSTVTWTGKKVLGLHTGNINIASGNLEWGVDQITGGEIMMDMTSIVVTDIDDPKTNKDFKDHLFNDDFFAVVKYPHSHLLIHSGTAIGNDQYHLKGILTIKDIAHSVSFTAKVEVFTDTLFSLGELVIDRTLYNIRYGSGKFIDNLGDKLIHDGFVLQFKLVGQKETSTNSQTTHSMAILPQQILI